MMKNINCRVNFGGSGPTQRPRNQVLKHLVARAYDGKHETDNTKKHFVMARTLQLFKEFNNHRATLKTGLQYYVQCIFRVQSEIATLALALVDFKN